MTAARRIKTEPWLPEYLAQKNGYALLFAPFEGFSTTAEWAPDELESYRAAFETPGALTAMINYYRAMFRPTTAPSLRRAKIEAPVLVLWGERDPYLGRRLAQPDPAWVPRARVEYLADLGHFIQHEQPDVVSQRLVAFLREGDET